MWTHDHIMYGCGRASVDLVHVQERLDVYDMNMSRSGAALILVHVQDRLDANDMNMSRSGAA